MTDEEWAVRIIGIIRYLCLFTVLYCIVEWAPSPWYVAYGLAALGLHNFTFTLVLYGRYHPGGRHE